jgi:hypothetical protein
MERRWAGPQAGCYLLHCAADRRKEREGLGPDSVQERKSPFFQKSFLFLFSKSILLFWKQYENSNFYETF